MISFLPPIGTTLITFVAGALLLIIAVAMFYFAAATMSQRGGYLGPFMMMASLGISLLGLYTLGIQVVVGIAVVTGIGSLLQLRQMIFGKS